MHNVINHEQADAARDGSDSSDPTPIYVPAAGSPGELTVLERLEAFRHLIRQGHTLLGEVVSYCRDAESALAQIAVEKQDIDRLKEEVNQARSRADAEAAAAKNAAAQAESQRRDAAEMRAQLVRLQAEVQDAQRARNGGVVRLEEQLREACLERERLQAEIRTLQERANAVPETPATREQPDIVAARLVAAERELADTRRALETERSRRDRAIALIKPKQVEAAHA